MNDLSLVAEKLGVAVQGLWQVLVSQAFVAGVTGVVFWVVALISGYLMYRASLRLRASFDGDDNFDGPWMILTIVLTVLTVALVIHNLATLSLVITAFANPEYWALMRIKEIIGK